MAGIGFALRTLSGNDTLSSVVGAAGHAAVIAAGPWLFTILSLAAITASAEPLAGYETLSTFRAVIIYAFATSLVLAAPITIVATRLLADQLWQRRTDLVRPLLVASMVLAVAVVSLGVLALVLIFSVPVKLAIALFAATTVVAMIWVAVAFCGAVRDYNGITLTFGVGLVIAVAGATAAALTGLGAAGMVWGFTSGLTITLLGLSFRVLATFPIAGAAPFSQFHTLFRGFSKYAYLAAGTLFGTAGVWVDKWVFWFSREGQSVDGGLIHAPLYDSAMFIASLVIIPALAQFVVKLETDFFDRYQNYYGTIQDHGTIDQIERSRERLQRNSFETLALIAVAHVAIAVVMVLAAPAIIESLNLQFRQIAILRYGALGSVFQFIFIAATSMVVFFDRRGWYCALQVLFFSLNMLLTMLTISWGEDYYGVGYFSASLISAALALLVADRTFARLNYLTFIGNNPSITGTRRSPRAWLNQTIGWRA
ncbi:MAG: exopolysaccharide Pel transporter PelG [Hyphomicrobium sp.]